MQKIYNIYTDGSCRRNGKAGAKGSWGFVLVSEDEQNCLFESAGAESDTSNQKMELTAAAEACEYLSGLSDFTEFETVNLYTDSAYLHNCFKERWYERWEQNNWKNSKKEKVANRELWERLIPYFRNPWLNIIKVKGHSTNKWNNYIDELIQREYNKEE